MNKDYNISNIKNFNETYGKLDIKFVIDKFSNLIAEFLLCAAENIIVQNEKYFLFVIQRGLETLKHCFKMIYMYSKNIDLTIYHCKKAYCYYVEFIGQIGDDNNSYLQLNSKDATLFVYKKSIFDIDNEFRKKFILEDSEKIYIKLISKIVECYYETITFILFNEKKFNERKESIIHFGIQKCNKIVDKLYNKEIKIDKNIENINNIYFFITALKDFNIENIKYANMCDLFVKKYHKHSLNIEDIQKKLHRNDCSKILEDYTALKFVNWLYN